MAIILKANKVNLFLSAVSFAFRYLSPNFLDTPHICDISRLRVKADLQDVVCGVWTGLSWLRIGKGGGNL
jgi:hypothetical protein